MKKVVVIVLSILLALSIAGNALLYVKYDNEKDQSAQNRASSATLEEQLKQKNADYDNSVHDTYEKYGFISFLVRMEDNLNRVRSLSQKGETAVKDEKIEDTLLDLANYAILAVIELRQE